jgi:glycosyltransferase involved in cell wall biosynthesis
MELSIITINWNNAVGLKKTMESVIAQSCQNFEYIVVDGGSSDGSVDIIKNYDNIPNLKWISEKDKGIYNAMNKGIKMASGEYVQFLNSGDSLTDKDVVKRMLDEVEKNGHPDIMTGNLLKDYGKVIIRDSNSLDKINLWHFYNGSINHPSSYIKLELFEKYGLYDESLRIVSDWKWFMNVIVFNDVKPVFVNVDVVLFDTNGISETNEQLNIDEKLKVLRTVLRPAVVADYHRYNRDIMMMERIHRHKLAFKLVKLIERVLFKIESKKTDYVKR